MTTEGENVKEQGVALSTVVEKEAVAYNSAHELMLLTSLKGPYVANEARESRAPIDLVAVIDRSGSMSGDKLDLVLKTMKFVIEQLKAADQLCIIVYDTSVDLALPFTGMSDAGKVQANEKVAAIKANSSTNLSGGLLKAIEQVMNRTTKNGVASIMLFTDGLANVGIVKSPEIVKAVDTNLAKIDSVCSIFTFGYGKDHDENMLKGIAEAGKGLYYFVETLDDIPRSFGDCLGGLLSVAAQNITLKVEGIEGVTVKKLISKVKGFENVSGAKVEINLGDIYSEEGRDIVALLSIPAVETPHEDFKPAATISLSYFNVITSGIETKNVTAYIKRPAATPSDQAINMSIDIQRNRLIAADAMEQASAINKSDKNARANGRTILENAIKTIQTSASADEKLCKGLVSDLQESIRDLEDRDMEYAAVQKKMFSKGMAHGRQRGHEAAFYDNSDKFAMKAKAKASIPSNSSAPSSSNAPSSSSNNNNNNSNC